LGCGGAIRTALTDRICHSYPPLTVGALESSPIVEPGAMVHDR
jgi:hypothetical protein